MLAPMAPSSPLFLAIQNHRNDEIQSLLLTIDYRDSLKLSEGGYSAIHVACRYNNRFALELLLSKGVNIELADSNGNTPLHYAAKYGHIDIVRVLLDRGSSIVRKNKHNQNPYEVAENHVVRQFMLPLVFAAERNSGEQMDYAPPMQHQQQQQPQSMAPQQQYTPPPTQTMQPPPPGSYGAPPSAPPPSHSGMPSMMNPFQNRNTLPTTYTNSSSYGAPPPAAEGIVPTYSHQTAAAIASKPANIRTIQPDGFHSSASDPELQRKYGHTKETLNIAPPPTDFSYSAAPPSGNGIAVPAGPQSFYAPPPAPSMGVSGPPPSSVYNRYVPYDPHTNSAAPLPPMATPSYSPSVQQQQQAPAAPQSTTPPSAPSGGNRLLGNKAISGEVQMDSLNSTAPAVPVNGRPPSQPGNILVFNPATDGEIINLGSSSNSVL